MRRGIPLIAFLGLLAFLAAGLQLNPREVPSPLVGKPAPEFSLVRLDAPLQLVSPEDMRGKVWLLNVWASWCASCRVEHPILVDLARRGVAPLVGLNYKDKREQGLAWLREHGDPYALSVVDAEGRIGMEYGVVGVPETFVIDRRGIIRLKHSGPVTAELVASTLLPLIGELQRE
jgi:cytochrome c biogenesis protein CcmG, thiol:disulfide interchange protein DsbE